MPSSSVLLIGATGRMGLQLIQKASQVTPALPVHAFARTPANLPASETNLCASVIKGDARNAADIKTALSQSGANIVVMAVGVPNSTARSDVREATMRALVQVIGRGSEFEHVKVVVVSSTGAGGTKIEIGMGMGKALAFVLRHIMADHDRQEEAAKRLGKNRILIVRPTSLTDGKGGTALVEYGEKAPTWQIDREDVAKWIVDKIVKDEIMGEFNITKAH